MRTPYGAWRAHYTPGQWVALSGPTSLVILPPAPAEAGELLHDVWELVVASASITDLAAKLASAGLDSLPHLAAFFWTNDHVSVLLRGAMTVYDADGGDALATGEGAQTWFESTLEPRRLYIQPDGEAAVDDQLSLPLVVGGAQVSAVFLDAEDDPAIASRPESGREPADAPLPPRAVSADEPTDSDESSVVAPSVPAADDSSASPAPDADSTPSADTEETSESVATRETSAPASIAAVVSPPPSVASAIAPVAGAAAGAATVVASIPDARPSQPAPDTERFPIEPPQSSENSPVQEANETEKPDIDPEEFMSEDIAESPVDDREHSQFIRLDSSLIHEPWNGVSDSATAPEEPAPQSDQAQDGVETAGTPEAATEPAFPQPAQEHPEISDRPQTPEVSASERQTSGEGSLPERQASGVNVWRNWQPAPHFSEQQTVSAPEPTQVLSDRPPYAQGQSPEEIDDGKERTIRSRASLDADHDGATIFAENIAATHKPSASDETSPWILAASCPLGHANEPGTATCRVCGGPVDSHDQQLMARPIIADIVTSDGQRLPLEGPILIGRNPSGEGATVRVPSPNNDISRTHVRVAPQEWQVEVTDMHSTNGTTVYPQDGQPIDLRDGQSIVTDVGASIDIGDGQTIHLAKP